MPIATITSKGQVTIPKAIREHLELESGHRLQFHIGDDGSVRLIPINRSVASVAGAFAHKAKDKPVTREEMKEGIGEAIAEKYRRRLRESG